VVRKIFVNYSIALPGLVETSSKELQGLLGLYCKEKYQSLSKLA
jgi:hypothetical protein